MTLIESILGVRGEEHVLEPTVYWAGCNTCSLQGYCQKELKDTGKTTCESNGVSGWFRFTKVNNN